MSSNDTQQQRTPHQVPIWMLFPAALASLLIGIPLIRVYAGLPGMVSYSVLILMGFIATVRSGKVTTDG